MVLDLERYGPYGKLRWRVPSDCLDESSGKEWLMSYFDGDGDVRVSSKLSKCKVRARSVNWTGLIDVQNLLEKTFGVNAKLYRHGYPKFPTWSQSYDLEIIGAKNIKKFADRIGFHHPVKKRRLARILQVIAWKGLA
jgi:intein-encoded DNA endonuclease-like protein